MEVGLSSTDHLVETSVEVDFSLSVNVLASVAETSLDLAYVFPQAFNCIHFKLKL